MQLLKTIITMNEEGIRLGERLLSSFPDADLLVPEKYYGLTKKTGNIREYRFELDVIAGHLMESYDQLVFIASLEKVIRLIGKHLKDEATDPAVVVISENGSYVITAVSGKGVTADTLTAELASILESPAVISYDPDGGSRFDLETIGKPFEWVLEQGEYLSVLKENCAKGELIGLIQDSGEQNWLGPETRMPDNVKLLASLEDAENRQIRNLVYVSHWQDLKIPGRMRAVVFRPRVVIIGLDCPSEMDTDQLESMLKLMMSELGIAYSCIKAVCITDTKSNLAGIQVLQQKYGWELRTLTDAELESGFQSGGVEFSNGFESSLRSMAACRQYSSQCQIVLPHKKAGECSVSIGLLNFAGVN